ncbi:CAS_1a_G0045860.mRNA.1.CDS.1 [Saccharomyces cerevisiae]|nr:CAS_1a_G0045860.mRNA.1.CDS.1 [Saccharomyces cerevisiae]CAI6738955.1 AIS_HP1_G0045570.mRNA.1.CDS.1 [Saccharomyces cerevisiae]CAI7444420.1 CAS_1a_G0045860.mRNA.1.CDS.1 [Saccharomyces cerevisiae]
MVNFYDDVDESKSHGEFPLIPVVLQNSSELSVRTIPTGNEIIEILLPWVLAAATFKYWAPQTSQNLVNATENDLLPADFVKSYHNTWKRIYEEGYVAKKCDLKRQIDQTLQKNIRYAREQAL